MPTSPLFNTPPHNIYSPAHLNLEVFSFPDSKKDLKENLASDNQKPAKLLVSASSEGGHGKVIKERALEYFQKLKNNAAPGVKFDLQYLEDSCYGGTCSAQSLDFADKFVNSPTLSLRERDIRVAQSCQVSSLELRTQQVALNAIALDETTPVDDPAYAKVASIVALRDFEIDHVPGLHEGVQEIAAQKGLFSEEIIKEHFFQIIEKMPEGLYFCRLLCNADNYKGEHFGHSTIFIKGQQQYFIWDPMEGLLEVSKNKFAESTYESYKDIADRWLLDAPRYYRIKKKLASST